MKQLLQRLWEWFSGLLFRICAGFLRLFGKELTEEQFQPVLQFVKFGIVGVSNTLISLAVYYAVILIRRDWYIAGNILGFVISVLNSYYWNSKYVFQMQEDRLRTLIRTFAAYGTNLLLGTFLLWFFVDRLGISPFLAPLLNLIITIPLNFVLNKFWVMKKRPSAQDVPDGADAQQKGE